MSDIPPPKFVAYPRPHLMAGSGYGRAAKLEALGRAYFGLSKAFGIICVFGALYLIAGAIMNPIILFIALALLMGVSLVLLRPEFERIAFAKGWSKSAAWMAICGAVGGMILCFGIVVVAVMQIIAQNEMKRYGLQYAFFGFRRRDVEAMVDSLRREESQAELSIDFPGPQPPLT